MAQVGDLVAKSGMFTEPGVVIEKNEDGSVVVDTEPLAINKYHRYMNTTGLAEEEKNKFNDILDRIYAQEDHVAKINDIQEEIDTQKIDPKNRNIVQYLRNQQAVLIRQARKLPRFYNTDETAVKVNSSREGYGS